MSIHIFSIRARNLFAGLMVAGFLGIAPAALAGVCDDADDDGICDWADNCTEVQNFDQLNTNAGDPEEDPSKDGFGNACDSDFNNDGIVSWNDVIRLRDALFSNIGDENYDADCDANGDGVVGLPDWNHFRARVGTEPGPAGE